LYIVKASRKGPPLPAPDTAQQRQAERLFAGLRDDGAGTLDEEEIVAFAPQAGVSRLAGRQSYRDTDGALRHRRPRELAERSRAAAGSRVKMETPARAPRAADAPSVEVRRCQ
jgi:hypothetical protein